MKGETPLFNQVAEKNEDLACEKFVTSLKFIKMYEFQSPYQELHILDRILVTLPIGSTKCERTKAFLALELGGNCSLIPSICNQKIFSFIKEARFFQTEDRRESRPSVETCKNREYVLKFYQYTMKKYI